MISMSHLSQKTNVSVYVKGTLDSHCWEMSPYNNVEVSRCINCVVYVAYS